MEEHVSDLAKGINTSGRILGISREPAGAEKRMALQGNP